jgi:uncharacterized protein (DUF2141 family)
MIKASANIRRLSFIAWAFLGLASPAFAQKTGTVTVVVTGVHASEGRVLADLCDDPTVKFPGKCLSYRSMAMAIEGETTLIFQGVRPGVYALQLLHDADSNFLATIPPEGFAYGNDQQFPPDFANSSFKVDGDTTHRVKMIYPLNLSAAGGTDATGPAGIAKAYAAPGRIAGGPTAATIAVWVG